MRVKATNHKYKEIDQRLKEQFVNDINDQVMILGMLKELTIIKDTSEITIEWVLS